MLLSKGQPNWGKIKSVGARLLAGKKEIYTHQWAITILLLSMLIITITRIVPKITTLIITIIVLMDPG